MQPCAVPASTGQTCAACLFRTSLPSDLDGADLRGSIVFPANDDG